MMTREPITLVLPWPVSANRYWRTSVVNGIAMTYISAKAKAYKRDVAILAKAAGITQPFHGRVSVHLLLFPALPKDAAKRIRKDPDCWDNDVRCIDLDNACKILHDALNGVLYEDDKWIWSITAERRVPVGAAKAIVTVAPITNELIQPQLFTEAV